MKQFITSITLCVLSFPGFAESELIKVARCDWGYKRTASLLPKDTVEILYPEGLSSWELCKLVFDIDHQHEGSDWVMEALSILPISPGRVTPDEVVTKRGQCEIGSILYQKKFLQNPDPVSIKLTASGVCRLLPVSFGSSHPHDRRE